MKKQIFASLLAADLSETREFGEAPSDCGRRFFLFGENGMSPNSLSASRTGVDRSYRNGIIQCIYVSRQRQILRWNAKEGGKHGNTACKVGKRAGNTHSQAGLTGTEHSGK